jgi:NADH:ubiquinone oxidoreductase subunit 3 (subunit A)
MNFLNMFSDLAPISKNGYRTQLYSDPGIVQGIEFLKNENMIKNALTENLYLIEQTDGVTLGSESIIEGMTSTDTSTPAAPAASLSTQNTTSGQSQSTESANTQNIDNIKKQFNAVSATYDNILKNVTTSYGGGIASTENQTAIAFRNAMLNQLKSLGERLNMIYTELQNAISKGAKNNFEEYDNIRLQISKTREQLIRIDKEITEKEKLIDYETPLAEEQETSILSRQRYYVYIMWFIITAIVLYITVSNLINPDSSFTSLLLSIILLAGLVVVLFYNTWGSYANRIDNDIRSINLSGIQHDIKSMFNFDPLVTIKYTS